MYNAYLAHHGIKGQKWGIRRWQYKDGSLTPEGYPHYGIGYPRASKNAVGSGHLKDQHRKNLEYIQNSNQNRIKKIQALHKESKAYKKALKNQEKTDLIKSKHEKNEQAISSIKNEKLRQALSKAENKKYEFAIADQERVNQGKISVKKAVVVGVGLAAVGAIGYAYYKSNYTTSHGKKMASLIDSLSQEDKIRFAEAKNWSKGFGAYSYHKNTNFPSRLWNKSLSSDEKKSVKSYTGNAYDAMNTYLRTGSFDNVYFGYGENRNTIEGYIKGCTSALEKSRIKEDVIVHRGIGNGLCKMLNITPEQLSKMSSSDLVGTVFTEKGFCSTGVAESDAWGGVKMHILVPSGSKGMYVDPISTFKGEHELLLQRNSSFVIKSVSKNSNGKITDVLVELIDQTI